MQYQKEYTEWSSERGQTLGSWWCWKLLMPTAKRKPISGEAGELLYNISLHRILRVETCT